jgi:hypothetical protein
MFSEEERDHLRQRLLQRAERDPAVAAAAITGSSATGDEDRWSDIDLAFAVIGALDVVMEEWTRRMYADFAAIHHWDLPAGSAIYRVYLLPRCLEVDIGFSPLADFGPRGPSWRLVFGEGASPPATSPGAHSDAAGRAWHHLLHARVSIERGRYWQAEHWIGATRTQTIALACQRLDLPASYAKGAHLLPADVTAAFEATLVRSLDETELRRALAATATALAEELTRTDPTLASRLRPVLTDLATP